MSRAYQRLNTLKSSNFIKRLEKCRTLAPQSKEPPHVSLYVTAYFFIYLSILVISSALNAYIIFKYENGFFNRALPLTLYYKDI